MVVPGHGTEKVSTLRLWKAAAPSHIDLHAFNQGDYARAAEVKNQFENISWVLYPNDSTPAGRELRLRQEYFFTSASIQDIVGRHHEEHGTLANLAAKVAIHLNDTHPAIGVAELMRVLCDDYGVAWAEAWAQTQQVFSYTNHTLMPEALETWAYSLIQQVLPRHMQIILRINQAMLDHAARVRPGDNEFLRRLSIIDESGDRRVRMANLSVVGSHKVNGVSALHSRLVTETIFADFAALWPERFVNMTNGVTPRRWLAQANAPLSALLYAPTARHGDAAGLLRFVQRAHAAGMGVLLDWVPAHFPTDAHGLARFDGTALYEYADPREGFHNDWNTLIYNFDRNEVRNYLVGSALHWLERFGLDGLRVDAVASMLYRDYSREA
ncbi:hypothetical protein B566_EDAN019257, partial [Ephemera danica]